MTKPTIDYDRIASLMDVVAKCTTVAPRCTALLAMAMDEINSANIEAQAWQEEVGKQRLKAEQDAAAKLNANMQKAAEDEAARQAELAQRSAAKPTPAKVFSPGDPEVQEEVERSQSEIDPRQTTRAPPVVRRTATPSPDDPSRQGSA